MNDEPVTYTNARLCVDTLCNCPELHLAHDGYNCQRVVILIELTQRRERELRAFLEKVIDTRYKRPVTGRFD